MAYSSAKGLILRVILNFYLIIPSILGNVKTFFIIFNKKYTNGKNGGLGKTKKAVAETATARNINFKNIIR